MSTQHFSSYINTMCGNFKDGKTTLLHTIYHNNIAESMLLKRCLKIRDLANAIGIDPISLSKLNYDTTTHRTTNNLIGGGLSKFENITAEHRCGSFNYIVYIFNKLSVYIVKYSFKKIRGDTLCFSS